METPNVANAGFAVAEKTSIERYGAMGRVGPPTPSNTKVFHDLPAKDADGGTAKPSHRTTCPPTRMSIRRKHGSSRTPRPSCHHGDERQASKRLQDTPGRNPDQPLEQQDLSTWATELAATLPPLTQSQAATVGRIATRLDARIGHEQAA